MFFSQSLDSNIKGFNIETSIILTDSIDQNYSVQELPSTIHLIHLAKLVKTTNLNLTSNLSLTNLAYKKVIILSAENRLIFINNETDYKFGNSQKLTIAENAVVNISKGNYSNLELTQSLQLSITRNLSVSQSFISSSNVTGYLPSQYWHSFSIPSF